MGVSTNDFANLNFLLNKPIGAGGPQLSGEDTTTQAQEMVVPVGQPKSGATPVKPAQGQYTVPMFSTGTSTNGVDFSDRLGNVTVPPEIAGTNTTFSVFGMPSASTNSVESHAEVPAVSGSVQEEIAALRELGVDVDESVIENFSPELKESLQRRESSTLKQTFADAGVEAPTRESLKKLQDKVNSGTPLTSEELALLKKQEAILIQDRDFNAANRGVKPVFGDLSMQEKADACGFLGSEVAAGNTNTFDTATSGLDKKTNEALQRFAIQNGAVYVQP